MPDEPSRTLNKQEAIRHMLHTAIRLFWDEEDPFAIHALVHAADVSLRDVAKKSGKELRVNWEDYIKPEYHREWFKLHRKTYNYFKHADSDFATDLPVNDMMTLNIMMLITSIANYETVFGSCTNHMWRFQFFALTLKPELIGREFPQDDELRKAAGNIRTMTPREYFKHQEQQEPFPIYRERQEDLSDIGHFYHLSFAEHRAGVKRSPRIFQFPEL